MGEHPPPVIRDRQIVRRALLAGVVVWVVLAAALVALMIEAGGSTGETAAMVVLALYCASAVSALWLFAAMALDALAGERIGTQRLWWTAATAAVTLLSPLPLLLLLLLLLLGAWG